MDDGAEGAGAKVLVAWASKTDTVFIAGRCLSSCYWPRARGADTAAELNNFGLPPVAWCGVNRVGHGFTSTILPSPKTTSTRAPRPAVYPTRAPK